MRYVFVVILWGAFIPIAIVSCPRTDAIHVTKEISAANGRIVPLTDMATARAAHTATFLNDGRVLIVGGFRNGGASLNQAEMFTPETVKFTAAGSLTIARAGHTATLLPDGKVLIAGGYDGTYLDSSEIFDPKTGTFSRGGRLTMPRSEHTATKLSDGRILLAGGVGTGWTFLADAEIYDPKTGLFTSTGRMTVPRESHTATLLHNGKVLITGGHKDRRSAMTIYSSIETYDPVQGIFQASGDLTIKRHKHDAVRLSDGRVLISGGSDERDSRGAYRSLEIFDPLSGRSRKAADTISARYKLNGAVIPLRNGKILLAGGSDTAEIFDPISMKVTPVNGNFGSARLFTTATLLKDGRVLIAGGYDQATQVGNGTWIFASGDAKME